MKTSNTTYRYGRLECCKLAAVIRKFFGPFLRDDPDGATEMGLPFELVEDIKIVSTDLDLVPFRYPEDILRKQIRNLTDQILLYWKEDLLPPVVNASDIVSILLDNAVRWEEFDHRVPCFIYDEIPEMLAEAYIRRLENA